MQKNINVIFLSTTKWDCLIILNLAESQNFQKFAIFSQVNVLYYELITFNWASTCVPCIKTSRFPFIDDSRVRLTSKNLCSDLDYLKVFFRTLKGLELDQVLVIERQHPIFGFNGTDIQYCIKYDPLLGLLNY